MTIKDFVIGQDNIVLPAISDNSGYQYQAVIGAGGTFIKAKIGTANPTDVLFLENVYRGQANGLDDGQFTNLVADLLNPQTGVIGVFKNTPITGNGSALEGTFAYDQIVGANTAQQMIGGYGDDVIIGNGGDDTLYGGTKSTQGENFNSAIANLYANDGNDNLDGGNGNDTLSGSNGNDTLNGGAGSDMLSYEGQAAGVNVNLETGTAQGWDNQVVGVTVQQTTNWGILVPQLTFQKVATTDTLSNLEGVIGSNYDDTLVGSKGNDTLLGSTGNDALTGGSGKDSLTGGLGADKFVFNSPSEGLDVIKDFQRLEGDKIQINGASFGATSTDLFSFNASNGALSFNGQQFATLENIATSSNFMPSLDIAIV